MQGELFEMSSAASRRLAAELTNLHQELSHLPEPAATIFYLEKEIVQLLHFFTQQRYPKPLTVANITQTIQAISGKKFPAGYDKYDNSHRQLFRPQSGWVLGVCAGLALYFKIPVGIVRLGFIVLSLTGIGVVFYVALASILPKSGSQAQTLAWQGKHLSLPLLKHSLSHVPIPSATSQPSPLPLKLAHTQPFLRIFQLSIKTFGLCLIGLVSAFSVFISLGISWIFLNQSQMLLTLTYISPLLQFLTQNEISQLLVNGYFFLIIPVILLGLIGLSLWRMKSVLHWYLVLPLLAIWFGNLIWLANWLVWQLPRWLQTPSIQLPF